jgi:hypothetical protein
MTNQTNTIEEFMRRHAFLMYEQGRPIRLAPHLDETSDMRRNFFHLHDGFERISNLYREFQNNYSSRQGPLSTQECRNLFNILQDIRESHLGDVNGIFTPLNRAADEVSARRSRPTNARSMASYHLVPIGDRQAYEERLMPMISPLRRGQEENYEISMNDGTLPRELWRLHVQPENFFRGLTRLINLEGVAPFVDENITSFENVMVSDEEGRYVNSRFGENVAEQFRAEYPDSYRIQVINPSIQSFRSLLPEDLSTVTQRFGTRDDLQERMRSLPSRNLFGHQLDQAYANGYQRDLLIT